MPISRAQKAETVQAQNSMLQGTEAVIVVQHKGLTVDDITDLRVKLRAEGGSFKVTKNKLITRALTGTRFEALESLFKGTTAIAISVDPVAAAKVTYEYAKDNDKITILGGALGTKVLTVAEISALAQLPSLDALRGKICGLLQAPATKLARVLQAPASALIGVTAAQGRKEA